MNERRQKRVEWQPTEVSIQNNGQRREQQQQPIVRVLASAKPRPYFDPWYLGTAGGGLRLIQMLSSLTAFGCILSVNGAFAGTYFAILTTLVTFTCSLILIVLYLFNLVRLVRINWLFHEQIYAALAIFVYLIACIAMTYSAVRWLHIAWIAASLFCLIAMIAFVADFIRLMLITSNNENDNTNPLQSFEL